MGRQILNGVVLRGGQIASRLSVLLVALLLGLLFHAQIAAGQSEEPEELETSPPIDHVERKAIAALRGVIDPFAADQELKDQIAALVEQLADGSYSRRESATEDLKQMNPSIAEFLRAANEDDDPEVAVRIKRINQFLKVKSGNIGETVNGALEVLFAKKNRVVIPLLLEMLHHDDERVRYYAAYGIRRATGQTRAFDPHADEAVRRKQLAEWKQWWKSAESGFEFLEPKGGSGEMGIVIANDTQKKIVLVDLKGKVLWERQLKLTPKSATILPNGHYLIAHDKGACEFDRDHKVVWDNKNAGLGEKMTYDIQRLPNGNTLVSYVDDGHVTELTREGKVVWQIKGLKSPGAALRLPNGNTLISENHANQVIEVDQEQKTVWKMGPLKNPSDVDILPSGNILVAEWSANRAFEVNRAEKTVWSYQIKDNISSAHRLADGSTLVAQAGSVVIADDQGKELREVYKCNRKYGKVKLISLPLILPNR